jgi:L-lactate dehydrogenase complex protein LldG
MRDQRSYERASRYARAVQKLLGIHDWLTRLPLPPFSRWTENRDFPAMAPQSFRKWWAERQQSRSAAVTSDELEVASKSGVVTSGKLRVTSESREDLRALEAPVRDSEANANDRELAAEFRERFERLAGKWLETTRQAINAPEVLDFIGSGLPAGALIAVSNVDQLQSYGVLQPLQRRGFELLTPDMADYEHRLAGAALGITGVYAALAETGSLVLAGGESNRRPSLLPPIHLAIIKQGQLVANWEELLSRFSVAALAPVVGGRDLPQAITLITGPSRTADIELTLCRGVHGPGEVRAVFIH